MALKKFHSKTRGMGHCHITSFHFLISCYHDLVKALVVCKLSTLMHFKSVVVDRFEFNVLKSPRLKLNLESSSSISSILLSHTLWKLKLKFDKILLEEISHVINRQLKWTNEIDDSISASQFFSECLGESWLRSYHKGELSKIFSSFLLFHNFKENTLKN